MCFFTNFFHKSKQISSPVCLCYYHLNASSSSLHRQRDRGRVRDTQTHTESHTHTHTERSTQTHRETLRHIERQREREGPSEEGLGSLLLLSFWYVKYFSTKMLVLEGVPSDLQFVCACMFMCTSLSLSLCPNCWGFFSVVVDPYENCLGIVEPDHLNLHHEYDQ